MSESAGLASLAAPVDRGLGSDRDVQRAALRDLVILSSECAASEAQIEQRRQEQLQSARRQLETALEDAEQRFESRSQQTAAEYDGRVADLVQRFHASAAELKDSEQTSLQRTEFEHDAVENQIKQKLQQAIWLAESLYEATQNQIAAEYKKAKEEHGNRVQELDGMDAKAMELLGLYGQTPPARAPAAAEAPASPPLSEPVQGYAESRDAAQALLRRLEHLQVPRLFVGSMPYFTVAFLCIAAMVAAQWLSGGIPGSYGNVQFHAKPVGYALAGAVALSVIGGVLLRMLGNSQVRNTWLPLAAALDGARAATEAALHQARDDRDAKLARATRRRDLEVQAAREKFAPYQMKAARNRKAALQSLSSDFARHRERIEETRRSAQAEAEDRRRQNAEEAEQAHSREVLSAQARHDQQIRDAEQQYAQAREQLRTRWQTGLEQIQAPIEAHSQSTDGQALLDWNSPAWQSFSPPKRFPSRIRFGQLQVDLKQITDQVPQALELPPTFSVPATLAIPRQGSVIIHTDHAGRADGIRALQMIMARLLTQLPPGRIRFTIIDPVGLGQSFAGFMHLADHDEALVGSRIWTEPEHIAQQLANLTEHMETVIQKYLRNEFQTIDEYNAQAGELAEPYRYLVIADFPVGFEGDTLRRLASIASSGARCGVFMLILRDTRQTLPQGSHLDEIEARSINLVRKEGRFVWNDEIFKRFPLTLDPPPSEQVLTQILDVVGRHAKEAKRVEVPFQTIAPPPDQVWSGDATEELRVPIGRLGATRLQTLRLGRGVAQHALIAGKTGSGKSTLLHVLVTNLALWYHPDEVEFYLVDFKKGVEFKTYATHVLPHARAIAVESDREFGLSVLQRIDAELTRRGELFRRLGVQDLAAYRAATGAPSPGTPAEGQGSNNWQPTTNNYPRLPRTLLIIDEFQEFFSEDDKLAQEAGLLLDRLVRQGRAFGIHVLLGSQTISGTSGLARSTIGQMAVRVALQTSEADSQLILGDNNSAARLLSRPGEAIYNDAGGLVEGNSPFQISWLPEDQRERYLQLVRDRAAAESNGHAAARHPEAIVFEGNAPSDIRKNRRLARLIESNDRPATIPTAPRIWLGEPVAIKEPTTITLRHQSGANVLIVGQNEEASLALLATAIIALAAQHAPAQAKFYVLDGTPADSPLAGAFQPIRQAIPHELHRVEWRGVPEAIGQIAAELPQRQSAADHHDAPTIYLVIYGLQRYRVLRKQEDSFGGFSSLGEDEQKKPQPDKLFADLLRDGPPLGIHTLTWADTVASVDRTLDRGSMREFDHRVLFQMSANDSSALIDSPAGNKLGFHRALAYSEELGVMEKFRPYALPPKEWLKAISTALARE